MNFLWETKSGKKQKADTKHKKHHIANMNKTKRMNCSPQVKGKTATNDTCYTLDSLRLIQDAYNKNNPHNKILDTDPHQVLGGLKTKLSQCTKEDCWLDLLPDKEKRYLDEYVFAPDQPKEWKSSPNEWLSNFDISKVLKQYMRKYKNYVVIGPTPIDFDTRPKEKDGKCVWQELCTFSLQSYISRGINKIGVVFNLDKHNQSGSHWTSLFVDLNERFIFYFDSAANSTPPEVVALYTRIMEQGRKLQNPVKFRYYENYPHEHQESNTECGMYALFFNIVMLTEELSETKRLGCRARINLFKRGKIPDKYVADLRNVYYNKAD